MNATATRTHVLRLTYGTSRGRETYGWNVVTLKDETDGTRARTTGGGYDMTGTVFGEWLEHHAQDALQSLEELPYGARRLESGRVSLDGACGLECMERLARAAGLEVETTGRKVRGRGWTRTGWIVTLPA